MNAPWIMNRRGGAAGNRDPFAAFVSDDASAEVLKAVMLENGWPTERLYKGGMRNAVQTLSVSGSPMILIVDLTDSANTLDDINALAEVCEPGTLVLALGKVNDVGYYRELLASGIQDYLVKPLDLDVVREAIVNAQAALHAPKAAVVEDEKPKALVSVIGVRGGVGASAVSASLAWLCSRPHKRRSALLDLDIQFGTAALAFDLEPGRGLTDALENPSRIDSLFIERALVKESDTLSILSAEAPINAPLLADSNAYHHLQEELRNAFDMVVVDLPRQTAVQVPHLLAEANHIVLVTELTLGCTRDTIRLLPFIKAAAPTATVHVVANLVGGANAASEVSRKDFEASIERPVDVLIPDDRKVSGLAARSGKCLADAGAGSKVALGLEELAGRVVPGADQNAAKGNSIKAQLEGLLSKFKKPGK
jgi:pilus assembly protein CpaE